MSVSEEEFRKQMGLEHTYGKEKLDSNIRPIDVFMCSIVKRVGYNEGKWIKWHVKKKTNNLWRSLPMDIKFYLNVVRYGKEQ